MSKLQDITGLKFNRLTVMKRHGKVGTHLSWECQCECGNFTVVKGCNLKSGRVRGCGCGNKRPKTHGKTNTKEWRSWRAMRTRCNNPNSDGYHNYGGRGIRVCDEWQSDFLAFLSYIGEAPTPNHTVERINNEGNYEPGNVKWATYSEQASNKRKKKSTSIASVTTTASTIKENK